MYQQLFLPKGFSASVTTAMELLDRPPELLRQILQHTGVTVGFHRAIRLRLVSSRYQVHYTRDSKN